MRNMLARQGGPSGARRPPGPGPDRSRSRRGGRVRQSRLSGAAGRPVRSQVHIDLLTGRVWLVPTFKNATSGTAARNFIASVFRDVGLPDVLLSDRDTRFTSAFCAGLHAALGISLIFGSPHHHTTSKVE